MEQMKHQGGVAPSAEDTAKLNEFVTWLTDHGFTGVILVRKGDVGVSWVHEEDAKSIRHLLIKSIESIFMEDEKAAMDLVKGMVGAIAQMNYLGSQL